MAVIFNAHAREHDYEEIKFEDIKAKSPGLRLYETNTTPVTISCHCELTLALNAPQLNPPQQFGKPKPLDVGVSKRLWWLCQWFIESLTRDTSRRFRVSENQGKIHNGWAMPSRTPDTVKSAINELVEWEICDLRETIIARRRSDLFPKNERWLEGELDGLDLPDKSYKPNFWTT